MIDRPLHLLHTRPSPAHLAAWATRHGLLQAQGDLGYALHALLYTVFGDDAPRPFSYIDAEYGLLAYTRLSSSDIASRVADADPDAVAALGLLAPASHRCWRIRPFPTVWPAGHVLGFEVRVRPVVREGKSGKERDVFLKQVEATRTSIDREAAYGDWLRMQIGVPGSGSREPWQGGAEIIDVRMTRFRLLEVMRQTQRTVSTATRRRCRVSGPEAVLAGRIRVVDPPAFARLIARGVGRHRSFGFGMLLLRPAA